MSINELLSYKKPVLNFTHVNELEIVEYVYLKLHVKREKIR